jgi:hypothetical protein
MKLMLVICIFMLVLSSSCFALLGEHKGDTIINNMVQGLTKQYADSLYCTQNGNCNITNLKVINETVLNINSSNITGVISICDNANPKKCYSLAQLNSSPDLTTYWSGLQLLNGTLAQSKYYWTGTQLLNGTLATSSMLGNYLLRSGSNANQNIILGSGFPSYGIEANYFSSWDNTFGNPQSIQKGEIRGLINKDTIYPSPTLDYFINNVKTFYLQYFSKPDDEHGELWNTVLDGGIRLQTGYGQDSITIGKENTDIYTAYTNNEIVIPFANDYGSLWEEVKMRSKVDIKSYVNTDMTLRVDTQGYAMQGAYITNGYQYCYIADASASRSLTCNADISTTANSYAANYYASTALTSPTIYASLITERLGGAGVTYNSKNYFTGKGTFTSGLNVTNGFNATGQINFNGSLNMFGNINQTSGYSNFQNITISQLIKLNQSILPICNLNRYGSIGLNSTGLYLCNSSSIWKFIIS